ncbi:hypothetical protein [Streptosporangium carneum]|uniref:Tat pathway signal sequence domain protein n=1 Tax=Streptosporangium carneum TaxID=47481 RepID=A0A9W6HZA9_9ACTN|nr:hypothetical protein [Streptosporangium carneum]GLK08823.1 hypothetical protein GCM10017600_22280 [Streptosporangium carneum]
MSHLPRRLAAAALAAVLGGTLLVQTPATAAVPTVASAVSTASTASSASAADFRYEVYFPKYTRRGGYLTYTVKVRNKRAKGQHYVALVGEFSRHFRRVKVIDRPRSVRCSVKGRAVACLVSSLDKGDLTSIRIRGWVGSRRGTAVARFGAVVTDNPDISLKRLTKAIRRHINAKSKVL